MMISSRESNLRPIATVMVKADNENGYKIINKRDFDPKTHKEYKPPKKPDSKPVEKKEKPEQPKEESKPKRKPGRPKKSDGKKIITRKTDDE